MEHPHFVSTETAPQRGRHREPQLPWPQLSMTGKAFGDAVKEMEAVLGNNEDPMFSLTAMPSLRRNSWAKTTREFIDSNRFARPKRPGQKSHVSANRACRFLFDWVEQTKISRQEAERQRQSALFFSAADASSPEPTGTLNPQASLHQLYCRDILILLTCILGFESTADLRQLTGVSAYMVLLASLLHRLFYAPPGGISFEVFREEVMGLLEEIGRQFGVEFDREPVRRKK